MDNAESTLKTKLKQLQRAEEKADQALKGEKQSAIKRQLTNLKELFAEVDSARRTVEALKIEAKFNDGDISDWNDAITEKIEEADGHIENLEEWLANRKMEAEKQEREEKNEVRNQTSRDEAKITGRPSNQGWKPKVVRGNHCW